MFPASSSFVHILCRCVCRGEVCTMHWALDSTEGISGTTMWAVNVQNLGLKINLHWWKPRSPPQLACSHEPSCKVMYSVSSAHISAALKHCLLCFIRLHCHVFCCSVTSGDHSSVPMILHHSKINWFSWFNLFLQFLFSSLCISGFSLLFQIILTPTVMSPSAAPGGFVGFFYTIP